MCSCSTELFGKIMEGGEIMEYLVNLILGSSESLDVYVIVRLLVFLIVMEVFAMICAILGGFKK